MNITFLHNVYNRHETLLETINRERELYPDSKIHVAYNNNGLNINKLSKINNVSFHYFPQTTHKIGCSNGFLLSIKGSVNDGSDVYFFSHDDVSISNYEVFTKKINLVKDGIYDIICRKPEENLGNNYFMMEGVFMSPRAIEVFSKTNLFANENELPTDIGNSYSPEVFLGQLITNSGLKYNVLEYNHRIDDYNKVLTELLGLHHKNAGKRGWKD